MSEKPQPSKEEIFKQFQEKLEEELDKLKKPEETPHADQIASIMLAVAEQEPNDMRPIALAVFLLVKTQMVQTDALFDLATQVRGIRKRLSDR